MTREEAEYISKADYETRLKADKVDMLTELETEIKEMPRHYDARDLRDFINLIQQKIDTLKE